METQNKAPEVETQNQAEQKSEIKKMSYKGVELSSDNKLTKEELKTIENLLVTDLKEIQQETQGKLEDLKNVIIEDLKARVDRNPEGKSTKYIKHLIERTENHLKVEEKTETSTENNQEDTTSEVQENQEDTFASKVIDGTTNLVGTITDSVLNVSKRAKEVGEMIRTKAEENKVEQPVEEPADIENQIASANQ